MVITHFLPLLFHPFSGYSVSTCFEKGRFSIETTGREGGKIPGKSDWNLSVLEEQTVENHLVGLLIFFRVSIICLFILYDLPTNTE